MSYYIAGGHNGLLEQIEQWAPVFSQSICNGGSIGSMLIPFKMDGSSLWATVQTFDIFFLLKWNAWRILTSPCLPISSSPQSATKKLLETLMASQVFTSSSESLSPRSAMTLDSSRDVMKLKWSLALSPFSLNTSLTRRHFCQTPWRLWIFCQNCLRKVLFMIQVF